MECTPTESATSVQIVIRPEDDITSYPVEKLATPEAGESLREQEIPPHKPGVLWSVLTLSVTVVGTYWVCGSLTPLVSTLLSTKDIGFSKPVQVNVVERHGVTTVIVKVLVSEIEVETDSATRLTVCTPTWVIDVLSTQKFKLPYCNVVKAETPAGDVSETV